MIVPATMAALLALAKPGVGIGFGFSLGAGAGAAFAQEAGMPTRSPAYLRDVVTLSGILGAAHGVRYVCQGDGDQYWRQHMMDLLAIEAPDRGSLRDSMVRAFNSSFTRMRERYRRCTDDLRAEEAAYAAEGRDLANKMAASYFPRPQR